MLWFRPFIPGAVVWMGSSSPLGQIEESNRSAMAWSGMGPFGWAGLGAISREPAAAGRFEDKDAGDCAEEVDRVQVPGRFESSFCHFCIHGNSSLKKF